MALHYIVVPSMCLAVAFMLHGCGGPVGGGGATCDACGASASYTEALSTSGSHEKRTITASGCPNHYNYCTGKGSDGIPNCGIIGGEGAGTEAKVMSHQYEIPAAPVLATSTKDVECQAGAIAIALNGVSIYSGWVAPPCTVVDVDDDSAEWTSFDYCSGHAQREGDYHYHFPPSCLVDQANSANPTSDGHSPQVGWSFDGFPIYGNLGPGGTPVGHTSQGCTGDSCLDECGGQAKEIPTLDGFKYRYYMAGAVSDLYSFPSNPKPSASHYPFTLKCYKGCTFEELSSGASKCTGGQSGVRDGYTAAASSGYTELYRSTADQAADLQCGNHQSPTQAAASACDAELGPEQGNCPVAKCAAPPDGCSMATQYAAASDGGCCPKLCYFVDGDGNECGEGPGTAEASVAEVEAPRSSAISAKLAGVIVAVAAGIFGVAFAFFAYRRQPTATADELELADNRETASAPQAAESVEAGDSAGAAL